MATEAPGSANDRRAGGVAARPHGSVRTTLPADLERAVAERLERAGAEHVLERVWRRDASLWGGGPEIADRLGWLTVAGSGLEEVDELTAFAAQCRAEGLTDVLLLGMGGSSLAPEMLRRSFSGRVEGLRLHVLDSTDASAVRDRERSLDLARTLFVVSTKSAGTIETLSLYRYFRARAEATLGGAEVGRRFCAITDPGSGLEALAVEEGFRHTFLADPEIGGRYSALSPFGVVPAALMGADVRALLEGGRSAERAHGPEAVSESCDAVRLGVTLGTLAEAGRDKLTLAVDEPLDSFGLWAEQLVAESLGKQGKGIVPVVGEPLGEPGAYGLDRVFLHLARSGAPGGEAYARLERLAAAGHPIVSVDAAGLEDLGGIFFLFELATAVAGWALGVNPFDQPDVEEAKERTREALRDPSEGGSLPDEPEAGEVDLPELIELLEPRRYLAVMAYVEPSTAFERATERLRAAVRDATGVATTFGYGPRFLHSTGQLHKGGPSTGVFLQLLHDGPEDAQIPGAGYSFTTLKNAQALGDLEALRSHGLPVARLRLEGDPQEAAEELADRVSDLLAREGPARPRRPAR